VRKALNENPVVQLGVLAALGLVVALLLLTRLHGSSGSGPAPATTAPSPATDAAPAATAPAPSGGSSAAPAGGFEPGPGLPASVVSAYERGEAVVLLVLRHHGIDDAMVRSEVERLGGRPGISVFIAYAHEIARYARIAEGVDVDRTPALVVIRPKQLNRHSLPEASVSYGFRDADSVDQAVRDALYKGPQNLPFFPR